MHLRHSRHDTCSIPGTSRQLDNHGLAWLLAIIAGIVSGPSGGVATSVDKTSDPPGTGPWPGGSPGSQRPTLCLACSALDSNLRTAAIVNAEIVYALFVLSPSGSIGYRPCTVTIIGGRRNDQDREHLCNPPCVRSDASQHTHAFGLRAHAFGPHTHAFGPRTHAFGLHAHGFGPLRLGR